MCFTSVIKTSDYFNVQAVLHDSSMIEPMTYF